MGISDFPTDPEEQLQLIPKLSMTDNGVYGFKIFWRDFEKLKRIRLLQRLPLLHFVYLERIDVLGQSISRMIAIQTGQWVRGLPKNRDPVYNFLQIHNDVLRLLRAQSRWKYFLISSGRPSTHLFYENMIKQPQETVGRIARLLGIPDEPVFDRDQITVEVQRDAINREWRRRFIEDFRKLSVSKA